MYIAYALELIRVYRSAVRVVGVRGNERNAARKADDHGGMVEIAVGSAQLNYIANLDFIRRHFLGKWPRSVADTILVARHKVIKVLHARPARRAVVRVLIVPPV